MVDGATVAPSLVSLPAVFRRSTAFSDRSTKVGVFRAVAARKPDITRLG